MLIAVGSAGPDEFVGKVIEIIDGDSIVVQCIGRIRMADIDAYQLPTVPGERARQFTSYHLLARNVHLEFDPATWWLQGENPAVSGTIDPYNN